MHYSALLFLALAGIVMAAPRPAPQFTTWEVREAFKEGDGDPRQVYFYKQLSCGDSDGTVECTVGADQSKSYGVSWGADFSGAGWISAGFAVSEEVSTGTSHECTNKNEDEELHKWVCIWKRVAHTEYTVKDWKTWVHNDNWSEDSEPYQMWSPNSDEVGHDYVCAWDDDCMHQGAEWWGPSRDRGEPGPYKFDTKWQ